MKKQKRTLSPMQREIRDYRAEQLRISTASMINRSF